MIFRTNQYASNAYTHYLIYKYDAMGKRVGKYDYCPSIDNFIQTSLGSLPLLSRQLLLRQFGSKETLYLRDANGEVLSVIERANFGGFDFSYSQHSEWNIYGSEQQGRFAVVSPKKKIYDISNNFVTLSPSQYDRSIGDKAFELKDHLGNVRVTVSDRKFTSNQAENLTATSYLPFGMIEPNMFQAGTHRWGYNGTHENDNEVAGNGNHLDFGGYGYDPRVARRWNIEPKYNEMPGWSPYNVFYNNTNIYHDHTGKFAIYIHQRITKWVLNFEAKTILQNNFRDHVMYGNAGADLIGFAADFHFDGRENFVKVNQTWDKLNKSIKETVNNIGYFNKEFGGSDAVKLGVLLHTVQDFYSHSNYIELYIQYYKDNNNGKLPDSAPIYTDGVLDTKFKSILEKKLRTGTFHLTDSEHIDINQFKENADSPTSHNNMNKDQANTFEGRLAEQTATEHFAQIVGEIK